MGNTLHVKLYTAVKKNNIEMVRECLEHGANANQKGKNGRTALIRAVENNRNDIVLLLINHGADVNLSDDVRGTLPILIASRKGNVDIVRILIEKGADINKQDKYGKNALFYACVERKPDIVEVLIENNANEVHCDKYINQYSSVKIAVQKGIHNRYSKSVHSPTTSLTRGSIESISSKSYFDVDVDLSDRNQSNHISPIIFGCPIIYDVDSDEENILPSNETKKNCVDNIIKVSTTSLNSSYSSDHGDNNNDNPSKVSKSISTVGSSKSLLNSTQRKHNSSYTKENKQLPDFGILKSDTTLPPPTSNKSPNIAVPPSEKFSNKSNFSIEIPNTSVSNTIQVEGKKITSTYTSVPTYSSPPKSNKSYEIDEIKDSTYINYDGYAFPLLITQTSGEQKTAFNEQNLQEKIEGPDNYKTPKAAKLTEAAVGVLTAGLMVASCIPLVTPIAKLCIQLIELCETSKCNKDSFEKLKQRLQALYNILYDIKESQSEKIKNNKSFQNLEKNLQEAINILSGYTKSGWINKILTIKTWKYEFETIDKQITDCLIDINTTLQFNQIKYQQNTYEILSDIQIKIEKEGLFRLTSSELEKIGVSMTEEFFKELSKYIKDLEEQVKILIEDSNTNSKKFQNDLNEIKEMITKQLLQNQSNQNQQVLSSSEEEDLKLIQCWKPLEEPQFYDEMLGKGNFGEVYKGRYLYDDVAIKVSKDKKLDSNFIKEIKIHLKLCKFPGVVQIKAISLESSLQKEQYPYIIMERAVCSLADAIHNNTLSTSLPLVLKLHLLLQVVSALHTISSANVIHRDIKPSNILLFRDSSYEQNHRMIAKICDFGLAKFDMTTSSSNASVLKGTLPYLAPELLNSNSPPPIKYSIQSDIYAFAITLNEVLIEEKPCLYGFSSSKRPEIYKIKYGSSAGEMLQKLIEESWDDNINRRPLFLDIRRRLKDIFDRVLDESFSEKR